MLEAKLRQRNGLTVDCEEYVSRLLYMVDWRASGVWLILPWLLVFTHKDYWPYQSYGRAYTRQRIKNGLSV